MTDLVAVRRDLLRGWSALPADQAPIAFDRHVIERFGERVRPSLDYEAVERELSRLLATAVITATPPAWYRPEKDATAIRPIAFLLLADGAIVMPVVARGGALRPMTTLVPGIVEGA